MYPMPSIDSILQMLPSKKFSSREHRTQKDSEDIRLDFEEEIKMSYPTSQNRESDGLQGQGEEITLTDAELTDLQQLLDIAPSQSNQFDLQIDSVQKPKERKESSDRIQFTDDLINLNTQKGSLNRKNQNKSIPRHLVNVNPGRNMAMQNQLHNQNTMGHQNHPNLHRPMIQMHNQQRFNPMMATPNNMNQHHNINFGAQFRNAAGPHQNVMMQKQWNSAQRMNNNMMKPVMSGPMPAGPYPPMVNQPISGNAFAPPKPNVTAPKMINQDMVKPASKKEPEKASNPYVTEDWFAKINKGTEQATIGSKDGRKSSFIDKEDSFLLHCNSKGSDDAEESKQTNSALQDLKIEDFSPKSPTRKGDAPLLMRGMSNTSDNNKDSLVRESEDIKKELHFIQQEKELVDRVSYTPTQFYISIFR